MSARPLLPTLRFGGMRSAIRFVIQLAAGIAAVPAALGQHASDPRFESCTNTEQRIELTVVAQAPVGDAVPTLPNLNWVIKQMPAADAIFTCERAKTNILQVLARTEPAPGNFKVAPDGLDFDVYLDETMFGVGGLEVRKPGGLDTPPGPADLGKEFKVVLCITPGPQACDAPPAASAAIEVATATGRASPLPGIAGATVGDSVPVRLFYSAEDLADVRKDPAIVTEEQAQQRVRAELLEVAATIHTEAVKSGGLAAGKPTFQSASDPLIQTSANSFEVALKNRYSPNGGIFAVDWLQAEPELRCEGCRADSTTPAAWVWSMEKLRLVEGVNIEVIEEDWETKEVQGETIAAKLSKRRQAAYRELNGAKRPDFAVKAGHIVSLQQIGGLEQPERAGEGDLGLLESLVEAVEKVKSGPILAPDSPAPALGTPTGRNLIYAVRRKKQPELTLAIKARGSYSEEEGGTGGFGVEEVNLLRLKETIALDAQAGAEVQKYRFSFTRPFARSAGAGFAVRDFSIDAQLYRDQDRRLGNLTKEDIAAREVGSSAALSFGYDSVGIRQCGGEACSADPQRKRYGLLVDVGFNHRDINIREDDKLLAITGVQRDLLPRASTQTAVLALGVNALFKRDFHKPGSSGLGVLELRFEQAAQKGFDAFDADYEYWKSQSVGSASLTFGPCSYRDLFISYRHGEEFSAKDTPIFALPLLGGPASVRGLEEGEFIGRRLSYDQFELGVNLASVYHLLAHQRRRDGSGFCASGQQAAAPAGPFDPSKLYLKGFFDHGRLSDSPVALAVRRAHGYGVALELRDMVADASGRRVNLSIGYGRSPQSRLHRSGLIVTGVTFEF